MSTFDLRGYLIPAVIVVLASAASALAQSGPSLGEPVTAEEVAEWDISIAPDGATLPPGQGAATRGKQVYQDRCLRCHGEGATGGEGLADPLVGGIGSLASASPVKTVGSFWPYATTLFDYIRRAMPYDRPMSLRNEDVYAVTAYILVLNEIIEPTDVLDSRSLPKVEMPNREGFVLHWPESN